MNSFLITSSLFVLSIVVFKEEIFLLVSLEESALMKSFVGLSLFLSSFGGFVPSVDLVSCSQLGHSSIASLIQLK